MIVTVLCAIGLNAALALEGAGAQAAPFYPGSPRSTLVQPRTAGRGGVSMSEPVLNPENGHYYAEVTVADRVRWLKAAEDAQDLEFMGVRGHLATLTTASENAFVVANLPTAVRDLYWLGGYQLDESVEPAEGWVWVTGEAWTYTNWEQLRPEPNNGGSTGENRLSLWRFNYEDPPFPELFPLGVWNDEPDWYAGLGFVVEFPVEPPPPPPTGACCAGGGASTSGGGGGTACSITTEAACTGSWKGADTTCGTPANPTTCCPANIDGAEGLTSEDIFQFLTMYFAQDPVADFDRDAKLSPSDIFSFLNAYFAGCSA